MFVQNYEADADNFAYTGQLDGILTELEERIHEIESRYNVILFYNTGRYKKEVVCVTRSDLFIPPIHTDTKNLK